MKVVRCVITGYIDQDQENHDNDQDHKVMTTIVCTIGYNNEKTMMTMATTITR
jgi:hypothetical protein